MILIKTKIGKSKINGLGLFAAQDIPKGTVIWRFNPQLDLRLSEEEVQLLPDVVKWNYKHYCFKSKRSDKYILCFDDTRFMNHSNNPNIINEPRHDDEGENCDIAFVDIKSGEEIVGDYKSFDADYKWKMSN